MTQLTDNYFELYGMPVNFQLDTSELARRHRELMSRFHPDKHVQSDGLNKKQVAQMAALLNESYTTLKSPIKRAAYLLSLVGLDDKADSETSNDGAFLMQQLELREKVEQASEAEDPFLALDQARDMAKQIESELYQEFEKSYVAEQYTEARAAWVKLKFFTRLHDQIDRTEQKLDDR